MEHDHHEQLSGGVAAASPDTDSESDTPSVRICPIPEGERTLGQSGKETVWDEEPLRDAVESGRLDGTKIIRGEGGVNPHYPMDEQVPPESIIGQVDEWEYHDGVGPVGEADIVDEQMAARIDAGLLEVSPDLERHLGGFDDERDAHYVDTLDSMPRATVLERGAAPNASIETAEALGLNPDGKARVGGEGETGETGEDGDGTAEQLAALHTIEFDAFGEMFGAEFLDEAVDGLNAIDGVTATRSSVQDDPTLIAVVDRAAADLNAINGEIVDALDGTPFEVHMPESFDWIDRARSSEQLADGGSEQSSDEPAEPGVGSDDADADADTSMGSNNDDEPTKAELREQLAAVKAEKAQVEDEKETLEEQTDELEETIEEKESEVEKREEELNEKEEKIETLEEDTEHFRRRLALEATNGNESAADMLVNSDRSMDDLAESAAESGGYELDDDSDNSYAQQVEEQLAASPAQRGESPSDDDPSGGSPSEEQLARADELAYDVLSGSDIRRVGDGEQLAPRELAEEKTGLDFTQIESRDELQRKMADQQEAN